jgi:lipoyl(octanoyl) transferase
VIEIVNWGLISYEKALQEQQELVKKVQQHSAPSTLVFCEHPTVITKGRNSSESHILYSEDELNERKIRVIPIHRGGDVTLHNSNQLIGYPIFHLSNFKEDLHWFLRSIEDCIIEIIAEFGIIGDKQSGLTGVWIEGERKICAIGIHCSQWVTSHGFALNVSNDLDEFSAIVPCGIADKTVTSITKEIGSEVSLEEVLPIAEKIFKKKFA